jgi:dipeptidyl aminopeptidase/acylaminoacyl peptidase
MRARRLLGSSAVIVVVAIAVAVGGLAAWGVPAPPSFTVEGMPRISWAHVWRSLDIVQRARAQRRFAGWVGHERRMFVAFGTTNRMHRVDVPGATPVAVEGIPEGAFGMQGSRDVARPWVVYALDAGGSERYRFHRYDIASGRSTPLTDTAARAYAAGIDRNGERLAFTSNQQNGVDSDVYVVDVASAPPPRLVHQGGDLWLSGWTGDGRLLAHRLIGIERRTSFLLDPDGGRTVPVLEGSPDGHVISAMTRARQPPMMFVAADLDGEYLGLHSLDPTTGRTSALLPGLPWDIVDVAALADGRTLALLVNEDATYRLQLLDLASSTLRATKTWPGGFPTRIDAHPTLPLIAIDIVDAAGVSGVWTYDLDAGTFAQWAVIDPDEAPPPPEIVHFPTFDTDEDGSSRQISAVVFRPREAFPSPQPVLIDIHGGPTAQALARPSVQDAVSGPRPVFIRPNVRGSTGYGRTFASLDDGTRRQDAVRDIGALLDWIADQPDLDASRVAVMGGSYGGYLTLAALAAYGERFRCGVDMFGITDLPAFIEESTQGHFADAQRGEYGDPSEDAMRRYLEAMSPVNLADRIRVPLFVYQGANDIRIKPSQSRALVARIRDAGGTVTYLEVPNEGHGLDRPLTQFYFGVAVMEFLERCLAS